MPACVYFRLSWSSSCYFGLKNLVLFTSPTANVGFYVGGNVIGIVDRWPHLGHIFVNSYTDDAVVTD